LKNGVSPIRVLKFVASCLIGDKAFAGGYEVAVLGLGLHFLIALIWAAILFAGSRKFEVLTEHPFVCGMFYGILVHNGSQARARHHLVESLDPLLDPHVLRGIAHGSGDRALSPARRPVGSVTCSNKGRRAASNAPVLLLASGKEGTSA